MTILACGLTAFAQASVSPEEKALLEKLSHDNSFIVIDRDAEEYVSAINAPKQKLYTAYLEKSPGIVKVFIRARAGWEGQYTMTWFTVDHGKVRIVEAYFGDPSGSGELQYVREYMPEEIRLGYYDKNWKCAPLVGSKISRSAELCIGYKVPSKEREKIF
ncbi:MAG: hypothetical protein ACJ741_19050 [Pyrinomonadaceae bacterium]